MGGLVSACGPDGLPDLKLAADQLVMPNVAACALLGRFGGSPAILEETPVDPADKTPPAVFAIGSYRTIAAPADRSGPLFIGVNARRLPLQIESLTLTVDG